MSVNKFKPHVYILPEDHANEQIANGFVDHDQVQDKWVQVMRPAGGWTFVIEKFKCEYMQHLRKYNGSHLILLIDFDGQFNTRRVAFQNEIPDDLKARVFVIGSKLTPEGLKRELGRSLEQIGNSLANDCFERTQATWDHDHLAHNNPDLLRLIQTVRPILFS